MDSGDKITRRQLGATMFVCLLSPAIRLLPLRSVQLSGKSAWVSPVITLTAGILYVCLIENFMKSRRDGEGLGELVLKSLGSRVGRIFLGLFAVWFTLYSGFMLRSASERMLSAIYPNGSTVIFSVVTLAAAVLAAYGKVKSIARTGQVFALIILAVLTMTIVFSLKDIKISYLLPVTYKDAGKILLASLPELDIVGGYAYFLFMGDHLIRSDRDRATSIRWMVTLGVAIFFIEFVTIGTLSAENIVNIKSPFFIMIRNMVIFGIIERIEAVIIALWVLTDFLFIAALLTITRKLLGKATGVKNSQTFLLPLAVVVYVVSALLSKSAFGLQVYSEWIVPVSSMALVFVVLPVVLLIGRVRNKI